jgi:ABC-type antimicrobial peptide transport system permease subunit
VRTLDYGIAVATMVVIVGLVLCYYTWQSIRVNPAKILREN